MLDYLFVCSFVKRDICPRKIGKGLLQFVLIFLEYKKFLFAVCAARTSSCEKFHSILSPGTDLNRAQNTGIRK